MKVNQFILIGLVAASTLSYCQPIGAAGASGYFVFSGRTTAGEFYCLIDKEPIGATLSSDGEVVIMSGTDYVPVDELNHCAANTPIHARRAAPHVSFLSDVNLKAGIYASMIPVAVSPMSFLAVVGRLGSDRNLVKIPGFYRATVSKSKLKGEASSNMFPVISLDGRYVSLDWRQCEVGSKIDVIEIRRGRSVEIDDKKCAELFNWER
ncbi:hypothetical protein [Burkholderia sp. Ac-20344]|uniref:hypothetical protein n=1 Tax=Burkholderia sp. Ac-20344 TaxID=2703890 RepID=UPI00197BB6AB|nr:hypothetical protein [Burkholderia sp. Ac-20344]MBN3833854.1 hypothetical protein [Burkholderia sp. Ac-20344]